MDRGAMAKLGEQLAERIEDEIIEAGWPVGTVIGSESELMERYGVSRAVFREAIRIVAHHGVAEMRRGPGGGLVVIEPDLGAALRTVSLHLHYLHIEQEQVDEARLALELSAARLAATRITEEGRERLKAHMDRERDVMVEGGSLADHPAGETNFHFLVAELTDNPAMRLFIEILSGVTRQQAPQTEWPYATWPREVREKVHAAHKGVADAILKGDPDAAERRTRRHLQTALSYVRPVEGADVGAP